MDWLLEQRIHDAKMLHASRSERDFVEEWAKSTDFAYKDESKAWAFGLASYAAIAVLLLVLASLGVLASLVILATVPALNDVIWLGIYTIFLITAPMILSLLLYALRLTRPFIYGSIEVGVGILLAMAVSLSFVAGRSASPILIGLLSEVGAIYIIVRGMDNIAKETRIKAAWEAFFIKEIANRLWNRRVEISGLVTELRNVLAQANASAAAAVAEKTKDWPHNANGLLQDTCGRAYIRVYKPTYPFRKALEALDARAGFGKGYWLIPGTPGDAGAGQSIYASKIACKAACEVLQQHFPEEEIFWCEAMPIRACYEPAASRAARLSMRQTKATKCRPANVLA